MQIELGALVLLLVVAVWFFIFANSGSHFINCAFFPSKFNSFQCCPFTFKFIQPRLQQLVFGYIFKFSCSPPAEFLSLLFSILILFSSVFCLHLAPGPFKNIFHSSNFQLPVLSLFCTFLPSSCCRSFLTYISGLLRL